MPENLIRNLYIPNIAFMFSFALDFGLSPEMLSGNTLIAPGSVWDTIRDIGI